MYTRDTDGQWTHVPHPLTEADLAALAAVAAPADRTAQTLAEAARAARTVNKAFLAFTQPTQAQALAQVTALTRQVQGLIRLILADLDDDGEG